MARSDPRRSLLVPAFYLVCLGIVYGSLFPFWFSTGLGEGDVDRFLASWRRVNGIGDILGNVVLFFPYGYLACLLAARGDRLVWRSLSLLVFGVLLAVGCQLGQLFTPGRDPSIFDLYINCLGGVLGWFCGRILPLGSTAAAAGRDTTHHLPLVIAAFWLASQLMPFIPSLDPRVWEASIMPLWPLLRWSWQACLVTTLSWLVFLHLLVEHAGRRLSVSLLAGGVLAVLVLRVLIVENRLSLTDVLSPAFALALWPLVRGRATGRLLAWCLFAAYGLDVVGLLLPREHARDFAWMPFIGYLQGSMLVNAAALCRKMFVFAALVLLLAHGRRHRAVTVAGLAVGLLLLEIAQRFIGAGTPTLTDPLLFLVMSWFILAHGEGEGNPRT